MGLLKWLFASIRKQNIKKKIIKRADICMYDSSTGRKLMTKLKMPIDIYIYIIRVLVKK